MIGKLFNGLFSPRDGESADANPDGGADQTVLAVACLLVEAARTDQEYTDKEKRLIEAAIAAQFDKSQTEAATAREAAEARQEQANDIHQFTKTAKTLPLEEKRMLAENLWRIILSDEENNPYEDSFMRRLCGLIYLSDVESGAARRRVAASTSAT